MAQSARDSYVDSAGKQVDFDSVYEGWFGERRYPKHYLRAVAANGAVLGFELLLYWYEPSSNVVDWQYPNLLAKLSTRSVARFDDNLERTNWLLHPSAGAAHYGLTRLNGFGVLPSFATAATSSLLYETVFEWRELISINDLIVTPFGGMAVGEFLFQLGNYLNSRQRRPRTLEEVIGVDEFGRQVSTLTLGLPRRVNDSLDELPPPPLVPDDSLGLASVYTHRFDLYTGEDFTIDDRSRRGSLNVLGVSAELAAMPGYLRPGHVSTWFGQGNFTRFSARAAFDGSLRDFELIADSHLFGHFEQDVGVSGATLRGRAYEIAAHTALDYVDRHLLGRRDQYAVLHLLSPIASVWLLRGATRMRLRADLSPDFAAPYSLAYPLWSAAMGAQGTKSSLLAHGYYFAWGGSAGASFLLSGAELSLSLEGRYGHYESVGSSRVDLQACKLEYSIVSPK